MSNYNSIKSLFNDIAVKIQDKLGNHTDKIKADDFPSAIESIAGGEWLPSAETVLATFARRQSGGDGPATIEKIYGKTEVWNQGMPDNDWSLTNWKVSDNATISVTNGVARVTCNSDGTVSLTPRIAIQTIANHKYCVLVVARTSGKRLMISTVYAGSEPATTSQDFVQLSMISYRASNYSGYYPHLLMQNAVVGDWFEVRTFVLFDLTLMYGEGKEPSTVEEFLSMHPEALTATYDAGSLLPVKAEKIVTRGVNQWDEEWVHGRYNTDTGEAVENASMVRNKNRISIVPNSTYYVAQPGASGLYLYLYFYDSAGNFIGKIEGIVPNRTFTPTAGAAFMNFFYYKAGGLTTMPATSFNLSDPAINGQYFPYRSSDVGLPILKHFPTGLRGVGNSYDEIGPKKKVQRRGVVDLGSLGWGGTGTFFSSVIADMASDSSILGMLCAKYKPRDNRAVSEDKAYYRDGGRIFIQDSAYTTAADFQAAVSGVDFEYPLADAIETDINEDMTYLSQLGGTEEVSPISAEFKAEIRYARKING